MNKKGHTDIMLHACILFGLLGILLILFDFGRWILSILFIIAVWVVPITYFIGTIKIKKAG